MFSKSPMQSVNQQVPDHVCKTPVEDTGHLSFLVCHPFFINERMLTIVPRYLHLDLAKRYLHLDLAKHVMRNVSRLRLRAHTLKVEAAAWRLEDGSCVCDQCPGEDEHVQNEVHALLICQDHRVCELRKHILAKPQSWGAAPRFAGFPPKFTSECAGPPSTPPAPKICKVTQTYKSGSPVVPGGGEGQGVVLLGAPWNKSLES